MKKALILMLTTAIALSQSSTFLVTAKAANVSSSAVISTNVESGYITRDPVYDLSDRSVNRLESEHFQIIWGNGDKTGTVNRQLVEGNLQNLETIRAFYVDVLGMNDPCSSMTGAISGKYKTNLYIANTGLNKIEDDWAYMSVDRDGLGFMVLDPGALRVDPPSWVVPHEFAHVVTYHMGGGTANGWYEAMANWFRDQYLGSSYYRYGNKTYGPDADFFGPLVFNSDWYFPHTKNWYDAWPILLYITENPDNMQGLGLDLMRSILRDRSTGSMFDKIERLSGTPLKDILGGYTKRMVTYDFKRQASYKVRLNELLQSGSHNMNEIYTKLERQSDGSLKVPYNRAPMQAGYNIDPLDVDLNAKKVTVDFNGSKDNGADYRVTIVSETYSGDTRYSSTWNSGTNSLNLQGDEDKVYLVVCATPDKMKDLDIFASGEGTRYPYSIKVSTSNEETPVQAQNSELSTEYAEFNSENPSDVIVPVNLNGNKVSKVKLNNKTLTKELDYTVVKNTSWGDVLVFKKEYLNTLKAGQNKFVIDFTAGKSSNLTINIPNKSDVEEPVIPTEPKEGNFEIISKTSDNIITNCINTDLSIKPIGNNSYDLSKLKIRYYYSVEGNCDESVWIDTAALSYTRAPWYMAINSTANAEIKNINSSKADHYVEFTFNNNEVIDSTATLNLRARIAKNDWSNFDLSNDYSYKNVNGIVVYYNDQVINGVEP